ncbi:hypothetical protein CVT25_014113 [Psilocybe cyanescens]|uniref:Uncharacterized protein n=1 Tax=Psilocybe cyanescens TaxID=93625 RepID=A0A409XG06_PSICY|nr:hypothetical protein CVT25_014113 [Psilocybe cyanescens]
MDPMQQLIAKVREENLTNLEEKGPEDAKSIIEILDTVLSKNKEHSHGQAPPLDIIIYALNNILHPTFLPDFMSDFLHLFTMIEFYRIWITEKAALAIEMNTFYKGTSDANIILLAQEEEDFLRSLIDSQEVYREIFMTIVEKCCTLDLKRLWLANSNVDFWVRWNEYLSIFNSSNGALPSHSFHHKLSVDEIDQLRGVGLQVRDFMDTTVDAAQRLRKG